MATTTVSTAAIEDAIRARVLAFADPLGAVVGDYIGTRLYIDAPPATVTFPHAVMRYLPTFQDPDMSEERIQAELEIQVYGRTDAQRLRVKAVGDLIEQAFLRWRHNDSGDGLIFTRTRLRQPLPPASAPADSEVSGERHLISLVVWPHFLLQHSAT
jgi:hypothetical protein